MFIENYYVEEDVNQINEEVMAQFAHETALQEAEYERWQMMQEAARAHKYTKPVIPSEVSLVSRSDHDKAAKKWLDDMATWCGYVTIKNISGAWYMWVGTHWVLKSDEDVIDAMRPYFNAAHVDDNDTKKPLEPTNNWMANTLSALRAIVKMSDEHIKDVGVAAWLEQVPGYSDRASDYISMSNGLLHWPSRTLMPHTPAYWTLNSLPHAWSNNLGMPTAIVKILSDQFADDPQAVLSIQEMCGYIIVGGRELEKAFGLIGRPRSGKSTLAEALSEAVGEGGAIAMSMSDNDPFSFQQCLGAKLITMSDDRMTKASSRMTSFVLNLTGRDKITVNRKHQKSITTRLESNILIHSNEPPSFFDASGAIASRFVLFEFRNSFLGQENPHLKRQVNEQIPEFIAWSLVGYERLVKRGYIVVPPSSQRLTTMLHESVSDIARFLDDTHIEVTGNPNDAISYDELYEKFCAWYESEGMHPPTKLKMYKNLVAHSAKIDKKKNGITQPGGARVTAITGLAKR